MKTKINSSFVIAVIYGMVAILLLVQFSGCSKKSDPTPATPTAQEAVQTKLVANTWKMQSVSVDGVDQTGVYKGLTINFTSSSFTSTNGGAVWPASGSWSFTSADATAIKRDDGIQVTVSATDTTLKLTLTWTKTTFGGGRVESVKGQNVFSMVK